MIPEWSYTSRALLVLCHTMSRRIHDQITPRKAPRPLRRSRWWRWERGWNIVTQWQTSAEMWHEIRRLNLIYCNSTMPVQFYSFLEAESSHSFTTADYFVLLSTSVKIVQVWCGWSMIARFWWYRARQVDPNRVKHNDTISIAVDTIWSYIFDCGQCLWSWSVSARQLLRVPPKYSKPCQLESIGLQTRFHFLDW